MSAHYKNFIEYFLSVIDLLRHFSLFSFWNDFKSFLSKRVLSM